MTALASLLTLALVAAPLQQSSPIAAQMAAADAAIEAILAVPAGERTVANTLVALDDAVARFFETARMPGFMADVSTDPAEREAGRQAQNDLSNWFNRMGKDERIFAALEELKAQAPEFTAEQQRFLDESVRDYRRSGLDLPDEQRARLDEIDEELNELGSDFRRNIADDETVVLFAEDELSGVPQSFVESLPRSGELCIVNMKGPNLGYILGYCEDPTTRKKMGCAAGLRGGQRNVQVLEKIIKLRHERAQLLGYPTTAAYVVETKMALDPETVFGFYEDLRPKLRVKAQQDYAEYQVAKREHTGDPDAVLEASDIAFYTNWLKREKYAVDTEALRAYFSMADVKAGMFGVYQDLGVDGVLLHGGREGRHVRRLPGPLRHHLQGDLRRRPPGGPPVLARGRGALRGCG